MAAVQGALDPSWTRHLGPLLQQEPMTALASFLRAEKSAGKLIYPSGPDIFAALNATPFDQVKVVLLGQDPYHGPGQAHGLSFSVAPKVPVPPSLVNIFKEIERDLGLPRPTQGCLLPWARQGVLLLNSVLTVEAGKPGAHQGKGWESFTDRIVEVLDRDRDGLVFLLWGSYAQAKGRLIDTRRHCVLRAPHPSPLSAHRGFMGCGHFSAANRWLRGRGLTPIDWSIANDGSALLRTGDESPSSIAGPLEAAVADPRTG